MKVVKNTMKNGELVLTESLEMLHTVLVPTYECLSLYTPGTSESLPAFVMRTGKALSKVAPKDFNIQFPEIMTAYEDGTYTENASHRFEDLIFRLGEIFAWLHSHKFIAKTNEDRQMLQANTRKAITDLCCFIADQFELRNACESRPMLAVSNYCEVAHTTPKDLFENLQSTVLEVDGEIYPYEQLSDCYPASLDLPSEVLLAFKDDHVPMDVRMLKDILSGKLTSDAACSLCDAYVRTSEGVEIDTTQSAQLRKLVF